MKAGCLIAFEGLDGSGKSTQAARLVAVLREAGHEVVLTREPTDGPHGRRIREMARAGGAVAPEEELRCFVADRREHVARLIRPSLEAGAIVVTDRYFLSTVAYQGARGLDPARLLDESEREFPLPSLALLLEISPSAGLARVGTRHGDSEPLFEDEVFLSRVAAVFASLERPYLVRVDGAAPEETVHRRILALVRERLALA